LQRTGAEVGEQVGDVGVVALDGEEAGASLMLLMRKDAVLSSRRVLPARAPILISVAVPLFPAVRLTWLESVLSPKAWWRVCFFGVINAARWLWT